MAYVPDSYQLTNGDFEIFFDNLVNPTWKDLLIIDFRFCHEKPDYDGGLSFLDRLQQKLGKFHPEWNIEALKETIRSADSPQTEFIQVVSSMLSEQQEVTYYGV
jgi:hypothetical protein